MNPIALATLLFTLLAVGAVLLHFRYVLEVYRDRQALNTPEGYRLAVLAAQEMGTTVEAFRKTAQRTFNVEASRTVINLIVATIGLFSLDGIHGILWILFGIPVVSMISSYQNLKGRWRPKVNKPSS